MYSERQVTLTCIRLIEKVKSILGAVIHETTYVDCTVADIRVAIESAIKKLDSAHRTLGMCKRLSVRGHVSIVFEHLLMLLCIAMEKLSVVMHDLRFSHSPSYHYSRTVDLSIDQSAVLLVKTIEVLQAHCLSENRSFYDMRHMPATVAHFDRIVLRIHACVNALVDAFNTVHILTECSHTEKEVLLYSTATFVRMSKLLKDVYLWNRRASLSIAASLTRVAYAQEGSLHNLVAGVSSPDSEALLASSVASRALFRFTQEVSHLCETNITCDTNNDVHIVYHALLQSVSALGLMWNLCRKEGLEKSSFAQGVLKVRDLVYSVQDLNKRRLRNSARNSEKIHAYYAIVSQVDTALSAMRTVPEGPFTTGEHKFSELAQRTTDALGEIYDVFAKRIRKIEGIENIPSFCKNYGVRAEEKETYPTWSRSSIKERDNSHSQRETVGYNNNVPINKNRSIERPFCVGIGLLFILFSTLCYIVGLVKGLIGYATGSVSRALHYCNRDTPEISNNVPDETEKTGVTVDGVFELSNGRGSR